MSVTITRRNSLVIDYSDPADQVESAGAKAHIDLNQLVEEAESGFGYVQMWMGSLRLGDVAYCDEARSHNRSLIGRKRGWARANETTASNQTAEKASASIALTGNVHPFRVLFKLCVAGLHL